MVALCSSLLRGGLPKPACPVRSVEVQILEITDDKADPPTTSPVTFKLDGEVILGPSYVVQWPCISDSRSLPAMAMLLLTAATGAAATD